jgi:hypothetical protein
VLRQFYFVLLFEALSPFRLTTSGVSCTKSVSTKIISRSGTTKKSFIVLAGNMFLVSATSTDTICVIQKYVFFIGCHGPTLKTSFLVFAIYVSRHQKLIFNNKKTLAQI